ncbi:MAG: SpoVA/SpoVAEb family sporulation membrane protein [Firmicutes bacterium]|nr:SpoVA/SpoVAEb family sporulation membrane protein [Bacillota bacterium]MDY5530992.1 SpoVA/SpoVAEb family sporulation membrane protein [Pumilibacteraceae bacterium]
MKNAESAIEARNKKYARLVDSVTPTTSAFKSLFNAFWIGGLTCVIGQVIGDIYTLLLPDYSLHMVANLTGATLIVLAILFTGLGFYDVIARRGGAGSFLPITGFANAMSSASIEYKTEGLIFGTSVKMFTIVGPVVVNGVVWSTLVGIIHLLIFGRF